VISLVRERPEGNIDPILGSQEVQTELNERHKNEGPGQRMMESSLVRPMAPPTNKRKGWRKLPILENQKLFLVYLPRRPLKRDELQTVTDSVHKRAGCDVVVDFSGVDIVGCATLTWLLELRQWLQDRRRTLALCGPAPAIEGVFTITRLDQIFNLVEGRRATSAHLQTTG
jgi:anti-anti-sigma factor